MLVLQAIALITLILIGMARLQSAQSSKELSEKMIIFVVER